MTSAAPLPDWAQFPQPPAPVLPPNDDAERTIIDKVASTVAHNDAHFLYHMMQKESAKTDTKCRFLWPNHSNYAYFAYRVWALRNRELDDQLRAKFNMGSSSTASAAVTKVAEKSGFFQSYAQETATEFLLTIDSLLVDCSQRNIQNGRTWILDHCIAPPLAHSVCRFLLSLAQEKQQFLEGLHVAYLLSDVLYHGHRKGQQMLVLTIYTYLGPLLKTCVVAAGDTTKIEKIEKMLNIWMAKDIFTSEQISVLRGAVFGSGSLPSINAHQSPTTSNLYSTPANAVAMTPVAASKSSRWGPPANAEPSAPGVSTTTPAPQVPGNPFKPEPMGLVKGPTFTPSPISSSMLGLPAAAQGHAFPQQTYHHNPIPPISAAFTNTFAQQNPTVTPPAKQPPPQQLLPYHQLPAGLMVPLLPAHRKPYTPLKTSDLENLQKQVYPSPSPDILKALDDFYTGLDKLKKYVSERQNEKSLFKDRDDEKKEEGGFEKEGWEVGYLDSFFAERRRGVDEWGRRRRGDEEEERSGRGRRRKGDGKRRRAKSGSSASSYSSRSGSPRSRSRRRKSYASSRSSSRSSSSSSSRSRSRRKRRSHNDRRSGRKRSMSPPYGSHSLGGGGTGFVASRQTNLNHPQAAAHFLPQLLTNPQSEDLYESYRQARSYNFLREPGVGPGMKAKGTEGGCFRCGRVGHIARDCDDAPKRL
ncbi:hypothetical protein HDV05_006800 [Chytridiales sp. JEL 0842]|nr:hypothetical protein HDV05_006800 [Chytridiales sp. JEL 0842]